MIERFNEKFVINEVLRLGLLMIVSTSPGSRLLLLRKRQPEPVRVGAMTGLIAARWPG